MPVDENGFLGAEILHWIKKHRNENQAWFDLCLKLNRLCHTILPTFQIDNNNGQEVICATLFIRALGFYQAAIILAERGLINEAKVILRSLFDVTFAHCAVAKSEDYNGPQNSDSVISYTWEIKGGGPSGTNAKEVSAFI